jgi:hypothetical protein
MKTVRDAASEYGRSQVKKLSDSSLVAFVSIVGLERRHLAPYIVPVCCNAPVSCTQPRHHLQRLERVSFEHSAYYESCPFRQN